MAGRGPAPKPPGQRARRNAEPTGMRIYTAPKASQPTLPPRYITDPETGKKRRIPWPAATKNWWATWGAEPLAADFTATDWDFLLDTAKLHAAFWDGDDRIAGELRLRVSKVGATAEDRARLRITYAAADEADEKRTRLSGAARDRRGPLKAV